MQNKVVCVLGSTCTGKSDLALAIASASSNKYEIINADAMQVFKGLEIATNKPTVQETEICNHHMFSVVDPFPMNEHELKLVNETPYHASQYMSRVNELISEIHQRGNTPIIVGGTNFYIKALCLSGYNSLLEDNSGEDKPKMQPDDYYTYERLKQVCPSEVAEKLHPNDHRKIKNAIVKYEQQNSSDSEVQDTLNYDAIFLYLSYDDRKSLDDRIDQRVLKMVERGLLDEVVAFYKKYETQINSIMSGSSKFSGDGIYQYGIMQCIGYKEFSDYVSYVTSNTIRDPEEEQQIIQKCILSLQQATRRYARKQESWFRNTWSAALALNNRLFKLDASNEHDRPQLTLDAIAVCDQFINAGTIVKNKYLVNIDSGSLDKKQWQKYVCADCNGHVCNGELEYKQHLKSQAHKKRKRKKSKQTGSKRLCTQSNTVEATQGSVTKSTTVSSD
jgi:tRNA dimethylallyltransferase